MHRSCSQSPEVGINLESRVQSLDSCMMPQKLRYCANIVIDKSYYQYSMVVMQDSTPKIL